MTTRRGIIGSKGGSSSGGSTYVAREDPNDLRSRATTRALGVIGEGEIVGLVDGAKSIFFDKTALQADDGTFNFDGVTWWERTGTPDQDHIPGFPAVENETTINAQVTNETPVIRTVGNVNANAVRVRVQLTQGLMHQTQKGDLIATSVELAVDVRESGGEFVEKIFDTITGKTTSAYERAYRIELEGAGPWDIRVRRLTADTEDSRIRNSIALAALTEIVDQKMIYPDTALIGLAVDAEKFGSSIPQLSFKIRGLKIKVPSNYDPETREYDGVWDGTFQLAWTDNPAWCIYDLTTNDRYGLGVVDVDKWALYEIAQYCDELVSDGYGGTEPRFRLAVVIQTREDAYHVINSLISACRGLCYWASGSVTYSQDRPADPTHIATPANVENGEFTYQGTSRRARHSAALVTWNDPEDYYLPTPEPVESPEGLARYGWNPVDVVAFGCSSRGQAHRHGKWLLDTEQNQTQILNFVGGFEFADCVPGNLIKVCDPVIAGVRYGGRIRSATGVQVVIDAPVFIEASEGYVLTVILPDGSTVDRQVSNDPGETDVLTLNENLETLPQAGAEWALSATNLTPRIFRVLANRETEPHKYEITAYIHDPNKFARVEQGLSFDPSPTSNIPTGRIAKPTNAQVEEFLTSSGEVVAPGTLFSWNHAADSRVVRYEVQWRRDNEEWQTAGTTAANSIKVNETTRGEYSFRVRAIDATGNLSAWLSIEGVGIMGLAQPVEDVTGLISAMQAGNPVLAWDKVNDPRSVRYEVRKGASWATNQAVGETIENRLSVPGNGQFMVKAKAGEAESENAAVIVMDGGPLVANVIATEDEKADGWPGSLSGGAVINVDGNISLQGQGDIYAESDFYAVSDVHSLGGVAESGAYQIPTEHRVTMDQSAVCAVNLEYTLSALGIFDDIYTLPNVYEVTDIYGGFGQFVGASPEIRLQKDSVWQDWQRYMPGQYAAEGFDFRIQLESLDPVVTPVLEEFSFSVDVPDRVEVNKAVTVPAAGIHIFFDPPFNDTPSTVCQVLDATGGEDVEISNENESGFDVKIMSGGEFVERTMNTISQGY